jgi:hypothetical protein
MSKKYERTPFFIGPLLLLSLFSVCAEANSFLDGENGLPAYPKLSSGLLVRHERYDSNYYDDFKQETPDEIDTVEAWYRKNFIGAREVVTVGDYPGIRLKRGRDIVWIYNFVGSRGTNIEAMKFVGTLR